MAVPATIDLDPYKPVTMTTSDAAAISSAFSAITTAVNGTIAFFADTRSTGSTFAYDGSDWKPTLNILLDDTNKKITLGGDASLMRSAASELTLSGGLVVTAAAPSTRGLYFKPASATGYPLVSQVSGEANPRFFFDYAGTHQWGAGGASAADTNLYRSSADILKTDDTFDVGANLRLVTNSGTLFFGSTNDVSLYRSAADTLATSDHFNVFATGGDANATIRLVRNGANPRIDFGPGGATAVDTNLYRSAADQLKTDDAFVIGWTGKAALAIPDTTTTTGITIGGDTNLYRSAADQLKTDDSMVATNGFQIPSGSSATGLSHNGAAASSNWLVYGAVNGDTVPRYVARVDGQMAWGPGNAAADVTLQRVAVGALQLGTSVQGGRLGTVGSAAGSVAVSTVVGAESNARFVLSADGTQGWGSGAGATDTNLYRSAANTLKTDDTFDAAALKVAGTALAASHLSNGVTGSGAVALAASPTFTGTVNAAAITTSAALTVGKAFVQGVVDLGTVGASGTVNIDASLGSVFKVTTTSPSITWAAPTNPTTGQVITIVNTQSGYSTATYTINAIWHYGADGSVFSSASDGKIGVWQFYYNGTNWYLLTGKTAL